MVLKMGKKEKGSSVGERMAKMMVDVDETIDDDHEHAKLADFDDEDEEEIQPSRSSLRAKNVKLLSDVDVRYSGEKMSRKTLRGDSDDEDDISGDGGSGSDEDKDDENVEEDLESDEEEDGDINSDQEEEDIDNDDDDGSDVDPGQGQTLTTAGSDEEDEQIALVSRTVELEKAKCTQNQIKIWDSLLEIRIRMQRILLSANQLPQTETFGRIVNVNKGKSQEILLNKSAQKTRNVVQDFYGSLLSLQETFLEKSPELRGKKRSSPDEEEITSEDDDEDGEAAPETKVKVKLPPKKKPRRDHQTFERTAESNFTSFKQFRDETIEKWGYKTNNTQTLGQIRHLLQDRDKLVRKSTQKKSDYRVICKDKDKQVGDAEEEDSDPEIYDDADFYHQLLRELIERKSDVSDTNWLEVMKMRSKIKKNVDTKASKGRKIRYDVHKKLVGFMGSFDPCVMGDSAVKELFASVFGGIK